MGKLQFTLALLVLLLSSGMSTARADKLGNAQYLKPLSQEDATRVRSLLRNFDANSYLIHFQVASPVQAGGALGLANLQQVNTVHGPGTGAASTVTSINIFKPASTVTSINIFKQASTVTSINIFKSPTQQRAAEQLNDLFVRNPSSQPLSDRDADQVQSLLRNFDPNSYLIHYQVASHVQLGSALDLANVAPNAGMPVASTVTSINIFKPASTVTSINIFKQANISCCTMIPDFKNPTQQRAAEDLNSLFLRNPSSQPLSTEDADQVQSLLKNFDPNSYLIRYKVAGAVQSGNDLGLANLRQVSTVHGPAGAASTVTSINIFKPASTVTSINIFRQASTVTSINIFKDPARQQAAEQLNALFLRNPSSQPLSAEDANQVQTLLRNFDPNSYLIHYRVESAVQSGSAIGLANLQQVGTVRGQGAAAASTVTSINIFKPASTVTSINIFRQASTVTSINIFKNATQQRAAEELNTLLQKYWVGG